MRDEPTAFPRPRPRRDAIVFVLLPVSVSLGLIFGYFSGVPWLQSLVAPAANREFGLLENLQHLLLLACVVLAVQIARAQPAPLLRLLFGLIGFVALFAFVEELDYGLHYYEALAGVPEAERASVRNLHNLKHADGEEWATTIKRVVNALMIIGFVVLPFLAPRLRLGRWSSLIPRRPFAPLMVIALLVSNLAHDLDDSGWPHNAALDGAIGEFRELLVYYVGFLYLLDFRLRAREALPSPPARVDAPELAARR